MAPQLPAEANKGVSNMNSTKQKIKEIVKNYILLYPEEMKDFRKGMSITRENLLNKHGEAKNIDIIERKIYEIPETLFVIFRKKLNEEDNKWLRTKQGAYWFARTFADFRVPEKI